MCIDCKYYQGKCTNTNDCANKKELEQIRADVIEECIEIAKEFDFFTNDGTKNILIKKLEQLKEQI